MTKPFGDHDPKPTPFLLRFLTALQPETDSIQYDRTTQVNVIVGKTTPAVRSGMDVKTIGVVAEDR